MLNLEIVNDDVSYLANGQYAQLNDATSNRGMYWKIRKNIDGTYSLYNKLSGYPLDVVCGVAENGKLCQQSVYNGTAAQKWTFEKVAVYQSGGWRVKVQVKSNTTSYTSPKMKSGTYKMVVCAKINGNWDTSSLKSRAFNVKIV